MRPLLDQLHDRRGDECLGDRRHVKQRAGGDRLFLAEPFDSEAVRIDDAIPFDDGDGEAWSVFALKRLLDPGLECGLETVDGLRLHRCRRPDGRNREAGHKREREPRPHYDEA